MTGTLEAGIDFVISRIDESSPPGVSIVMRTAASLSAFAWPIPRFTYDAMNGSTTPFSLSDRTVGRGVVWAAAAWARSRVPAQARQRTIASPSLAFRIPPSSHRRTLARAPIMAGDGQTRRGRGAVYPDGGHMTFGREGPLSAESEQELMRQLVAGEEHAIRTLYSRFGRPIYTVGLRMLGSVEAAEELTQYR